MPDAGDNLKWCQPLYECGAANLLLYGRALGLSRAEAEDVLHDTFLALLRHECAPEHPGAYLARSFRNRALNHRRSFWRRVVRELESQRWFERGPDESPLERQAMAALTRLPVEQREVIVLKIWHGLTFDEVGQALEVSPNTAASRYRYGVQKLRAILEGVIDDQSLSESIGLLEAPSPLPET